ncbi:MAG: hypothetical protein ACE5FA_07195, partial [Dehalococcoidia bacterium]
EPTEARRLNWLLVFLLFFGFAIVQTWPLALNMSDHAIGWPGDSYVMWWNLAWVKESLFSLSNPFHTDALFYPQGSDLYLHTLTPGNAVLSIPLQMITGGNILLTWNIMALIFLALSGTGGYAVSYHATRERWMSLVGGFIFAFSPMVMMQLHGHLNIATTWPIPFFVLFLLRFFDSRSKVDLVWVAVLGAVLTWNWFEFAIDVGLFALLAFSFWALVRLRRGQRGEVIGLARSLLPGVTLWALLSAPILIPTALAILGDAYTVTTGASEASYYSPDLLAYIIPSPLWGPGEYSNNYGLPFSTRAGSIETTMFLGFTPLLLSLLAFVYYRKSALRRSVWFWSLVFVFFAALAVGPTLHVFTIDLGVPMPFRLLQEVPLIGERRVPGRMIIVGTLALGVLSTFGAAVIARKLGPSARYAVPIVSCVVLAVVFFEYWNPPVNLASYETPAVYEEIGREPGDFAVLDLPLGRVTGNVRQGDAIGGALSDYAQLVHGKAAIGGYLSRAKNEDLDWLAEQPGLGYLSCLDCDGYPRSVDLDGERVRALFTELRIKYAVVNLVTFEGEPTILTTEGLSDDVQTYLEETVGLTDAGSGDGWRAYRNPDVE